MDFESPPALRSIQATDAVSPVSGPRPLSCCGTRRPVYRRGTNDWDLWEGARTISIRAQFGLTGNCCTIIQVGTILCSVEEFGRFHYALAVVAHQIESVGGVKRHV